MPGWTAHAGRVSSAHAIHTRVAPRGLSFFMPHLTAFHPSASPAASAPRAQASVALAIFRCGSSPPPLLVLLPPGRAGSRAVTAPGTSVSALPSSARSRAMSSRRPCTSSDMVAQGARGRGGGRSVFTPPSAARSGLVRSGSAVHGLSAGGSALLRARRADAGGEAAGDGDRGFRDSAGAVSRAAEADRPVPGALRCCSSEGTVGGRAQGRLPWAACAAASQATATCSFMGVGGPRAPARGLGEVGRWSRGRGRRR